MKRELGFHLGMTSVIWLEIVCPFTCYSSHANPHMQTLTCKSSDIVWLSLSETVCDPFKFSQHMKGPMIRHVSLYLKLKGEILCPEVKHPANQNKQFSVCWCNNDRDKMPADTTTLQDSDIALLNWCNWIWLWNGSVFGQGVANRASFKKKNIARCEMIWVRCVCCILSKLPYLPVAIYVVSVIIKRFTAKLLCELFWRHL